MRIAEKFTLNDLADLAIGLRTLELLARDSVSDDDRAAAIEIARESGGLTFTSAASLLGGVRTADTPPAAHNPSYIAPAASQIIIFDDDAGGDPPDNPDDWVEYQASVPIGRMTLTRTTETRTTESAEIEMRPVQQPLPERLMKIVYIDPVMVYGEPPRMKAALDQLAELYFLSTGESYRFTPKG